MGDYHFMLLVKNTINAIKQNKKVFLVKVCVLMLILLAYITFHFQQSLIIRVNLDESTLIRNGQSATIYYAIDDGGFSEAHISTGMNPSYSIYEYIFNIDSSIRRNITQLRLDFDQIRSGDHIYIDSMSVKHPFFRERTVDNQAIYQGSHSFHNAELHLLENNVLALEIFGFDPHFTLPSGDFLSRGTPNLVFILGFFILFLIGTAVIIFIPNKWYTNIFNKAFEFIKDFRELSLTETSVFIIGIIALLLYNFDARLRFLHVGDFNVSILMQIAILITLFFIIKSKCKQIQILAEEAPFARPWICYLFLLILCLIVYVPALFTNPYFHNDEHIVVEAALGYIESGVFQRIDYLQPDTITSYTRAWMHTWLVAQAINLFGFSTIATRGISVFFGVVFILSTFYIIKKFIKRTDLAFLSALILLFNAELVDMFVTVRMYALMMPLALWMLFFIYRALHCEITYKSDNAVTRCLHKSFNFHFGYVSIAIVLILLNEHMMQNALILLFGVVIYVVWQAIEERQRKFVNLSIILSIILSLIVLAFFAHTVLSIHIPFFSRLIRGFLLHSGFGWNNMVYFWTDAGIPLSTLLGVPLLLIGLAVCFINRKSNSFFKYAIACYLITVIFFIFFAYRYYVYRYMAFIVPVSVMLISLGHYGIVSKSGKASRQALLLFILIAIVGHITSMFSTLYIEDPARTRFSRPFQVIVNDARVENVSIVSIYSPIIRPVYAQAILGNHSTHHMELPTIRSAEQHLKPHIDYLLNLIQEQPVIYFFAERLHYGLASSAHRHFLENATDLVADIDNAVIFRYHFVESANISTETEVDSSYVLRIIDVHWENDVAYLTCELIFDPVFSSAVFVGVEIVEEGFVMPDWSQHATHRFQVLLSDDFSNAVTFTLPIRPRTEAFFENINFTFSNSVYIYLGQEQGFMHEFTRPTREY